MAFDQIRDIRYQNSPDVELSTFIESALMINLEARRVVFVEN